MANYFPYSAIIVNFCNSIVRHPYFGDWSSCPATTDAPVAAITISELYY